MVNVGVDLHKTQFTTCARTKEGEVFKMYPTLDAGYEAFLRQAALWRENGEEVRVAVESTGNTRYFKNRIEPAGIKVTVINTLKMKVVNDSVKKTDKHDAATIAEFLEKDMLPESQLCGRTSEQLRRYLNARGKLVEAVTAIKNQIHSLLSGEGMEDSKASLQSKRGRKRTLDTLHERENGLVAQPLFDTIDRLEENIKSIEGAIRTLADGDRMVELLMTIPGCGEISAWTIRAYTDDIGRFASAKKYASYAGLAPWVQNSNERIHHGSITKRGPKELRTALVQVVMGLRRLKAKTHIWRLMRRYERMKRTKGSGKSIIATARLLAVIIWHMLSEDAEFDSGKMTDQKIAKKAESMINGDAGNESMEEESLKDRQNKPVVIPRDGKIKIKSGVASKKIKKAG